MDFKFLSWFGWWSIGCRQYAIIHNVSISIGKQTKCFIARARIGLHHADTHGLYLVKQSNGLTFYFWHTPSVPFPRRFLSSSWISFFLQETSHLMLYLGTVAHNCSNDKNRPEAGYVRNCFHICGLFPLLRLEDNFLSTMFSALVLAFGLVIADYSLMHEM